MKNLCKISGFTLFFFIVILNLSFAQSSDSILEKKAVMQKESPVYIRLEIGTALGYFEEEDRNNFGSNLTASVGYSFNKKIRAGVGAELMSFNNFYLPVFATFEVGDHSKRISPNLNFNGGFAFYLAHGDGFYYADEKPDNGIFFELIPGISFGSYQSKSRIRISLGNQFQMTSYINHNLIFVNQNIKNPRTDSNGYTITKVARLNMELKVGVDF